MTDAQKELTAQLQRTQAADELANKTLSEGLRKADEQALNALADRIARKIETERLFPIVKEMTMMLALESGILRLTGIGKYMLLAARHVGLKISLNEYGRMMVGPKDKIPPDMQVILRTFKQQIIQELEQERTTNGTGTNGNTGRIPGDQKAP